MGCNVYTTNEELGGPGIMYPNGVSHNTEPDHLSCVMAAVDYGAPGDHLVRVHGGRGATVGGCGVYPEDFC